MHEAIKERFADLLARGEIEGLLALRHDGAHVAPHLFVRSEELAQLYVDHPLEARPTRYPLMGIAQTLIRSHPQARLAVLMRGCDERAFKALQAWNQISAENVIPLGVACSKALAESCDCSRPYPDECIEGEPVTSEQSPAPAVEEIRRSQTRVSWLDEFEKCIKCYGCRNICPMCFCDECALESEEVVPPGAIPPAFPIFHLVRAVHMVGRCVDCGLCEEACPAGIPLRTLYKKVNEIVFTHFQFRAGFDPRRRSPLHEIAEPPPTR